MTLEEQIHRMGEARAASVNTPSWRDRTDEGVGRKRWIGAAVATILLIGGLAFWPTTPDPGLEISNDRASSSSDEIWVPIGDVASVSHGAISDWHRSNDIAVVRSDDGQRELFTTVTRRSEVVDGDPTGVWVRDGYNLLIARDSRWQGHIEVRSAHLDVETLEQLAVTPSIRHSIETVADWIADQAPGADVVHVGTRNPIDLLVISTTDELTRRSAPGRDFIQRAGDALDLPIETNDLDELVSSLPQRQVDAREWRTIVDGLLGEERPQLFLVDFDVVFAPPVELSMTATVVDHNGSSSIRLDFNDADAAFKRARSSDINIILGGVTLIFGRASSAIDAGSIVLPARLLEDEAELYASLINAEWGNAARPPPSTARSTQTGVCAANPVPTDDVLDVATHIAFDRTPLDLDQDGIDDEMLIYDDVDGNWWLVAQLQTGWTNALDLGTPPTPPGLAMTSEGVPAGTDLDGDGQLEFFLSGYIGPSAALVTLRECELVDSFFVNEAPEGFGASFGVQIGLSADISACQGTSCATRVRCVGDVLTQELFFGVGPTDLPGSWATAEVRLDPSGVITTTDLPVRTVLPFETLDDPPTEATTGVIDCSP